MICVIIINNMEDSDTLKNYECEVKVKVEPDSEFLEKEDLRYLQSAYNVKNEPEDKTLNIISTTEHTGKVPELQNKLGNIEDFIVIKKETDDVDVKLIKPELISEELDLPEYFNEPPCSSKPVKVSIGRSKTDFRKKPAKKKRYPCLVCLKNFSTSSKRVKHFNLHFGNNCVICRLCGKIFIQKKLYLNHHLEHVLKTSNTTRSEYDNVESLNSEIRFKDFINKKYAYEHRRSHIDEKRFECVICLQTFQGKYSLNNHIRCHSVDKPFTCLICSKKFVHKCNLKYHIRLHTGEKLFTCKICCKRFVRNPDYQRHLLCHTGEKPFTCTICSKGFAYKSHLSRHTRVHTGEEPYKCEVCFEQFSYKRILIYHMYSHSGHKLFKCDVCFKQFADKRNYQIHMQYHTDTESQFNSLTTNIQKNFSNFWASIRE